MADKTTYSALQKKQVIIPAFSVATVDYIDTQPNYFRVQNNGNHALYCGTAHIPTENKYDFSVKSAGVKMFAEPFYRAKLYIFNPSGSDVNATVLSFRAEFDPLALALTDIEIDLANASIESNNTIGEFKCSLPAGSNFIGNVSITNPLPAGTSKIGVVDVGNLINYTEKLTEILTAIGNISGGGSGGSSAWGESQIDNLLDVIQRKNSVFKAFEGSVTSEGTKIYETSGGGEIFKIHTISNDGEADVVVSIKSVNDATTQTFTLKAGEVLNDLDGYFDTLTLTGDGVPCRVLSSRFTVG